MCELPQNKRRNALLRKVKKLNKYTEREAIKKREKIQSNFWNVVGTVEHINVPKLEDAVKKEFRTSDNRVIQAQIRLMQTEGRIKVQSNAKVWIKQPSIIRHSNE